MPGYEAQIPHCSSIIVSHRGNTVIAKAYLYPIQSDECLSQEEAIKNLLEKAALRYPDRTD